MSDWINLNIDTTEFVKEEKEDGMKISVSPSPYDVPSAIKAEVDEAKERLHIEFRYISKEPVRYESADGGVSFGVGRNSDRLYEIEVNIPKAINSVHELVGRVVRDIAETLQNESRIDNYAMAKAALLANEPALLALSKHASRLTEI